MEILHQNIAPFSKRVNKQKKKNPQKTRKQNKTKRGVSGEKFLPVHHSTRPHSTPLRNHCLSLHSFHFL